MSSESDDEGKGEKEERTDADGGNGEDESEREEDERKTNGKASRRADQVACTERVLDTTPDAAIVANLGVASYVLAGVEERARNFYCWGSMGLTTSIGLGLALAREEAVTVFEGDGSLLMSLGVLSTVAAQDPANLAIVVWDNGVYGTTGGQPVTEIDAAGAARACGLEASTANTAEEFAERYAEAVAHDGAALVVCTVEPIDPDARPPNDFARVSRRFRDALLAETEGTNEPDGSDGTDGSGDRRAGATDAADTGGAADERQGR